MNKIISLLFLLFLIVVTKPAYAYVDKVKIEKNGALTISHYEKSFIHIGQKKPVFTILTSLEKTGYEVFLTEFSISHPKFSNIIFTPKEAMPLKPNDNGKIIFTWNKEYVTPDYVSPDAYKISFTIISCKINRDNKSCTEAFEDKIKSTFALLVLTEKEGQNCKNDKNSTCLDLSTDEIDTLFYIDKNDNPQISGLELLTKASSLFDAIDEIESIYKNDKKLKNKSLNDVIYGLDSLLQRGIESLATTSDRQNRILKDSNLLSFYASKKIKNIDNIDIKEINKILKREMYTNSLDSLVNAAKMQRPSTTKKCETDDCKAYLHLTGKVTFKPKFQTKIKNLHDISDIEALFKIQVDEGDMELHLNAVIGANTKVSIDKKFPARKILSKKFVKVASAAPPIVLEVTTALYAEVEIKGELEGNAKVEFDFKRSDVFEALIAYNINEIHCGEDLSESFSVVSCRDTKKNTLKINGKLIGKGDIEATLWIYPEVSYTVNRLLGAIGSVNLGVYAKAVAEVTTEGEVIIDKVDNSLSAFGDVNYSFDELSVGLKGEAKFRADLGLIYYDFDEDKEKIAGLSYPNCRKDGEFIKFMCNQDKRKTFKFSDKLFYTLPSLNLAPSLTNQGYLGSNDKPFKLVANSTPGINYFSDDNNSYHKGYYWEVVDTDNLKIIGEYNLNFNYTGRTEATLHIPDPSKLKAGKYTVRMIAWGLLGKAIRQSIEYEVSYYPPTGAAELTVSKHSENGVILSWLGVTGATEYWIYRNNELITTISSEDLEQYSYTDTSANSNNQYAYQLVPVSHYGIQHDTPVINYSPDDEALLAPTNLTATPDDTKVTLNWSSNEANHRVHYATSSFDGLDVANYSLASNYVSTDVGSGGAVIENLTNGTKYYFVVTALKDGGSTESTKSEEVSITTTATGTIIDDDTPRLLNDTGITWAGEYDESNKTGNDCSSTTITGKQDCHYGRDKTHNDDTDGLAGFSFTKLDATGKALTNQADTDHACVKDNVTGLIWEVKTTSGKRSKNKTYKWGGLTAMGKDYDDSNEEAENKKGPYSNDWNELVNYANNANTTGGALCGFSDWRVPNIEELASIVHLGRVAPAIDQNYFPNTQSSYYWSSSPIVSATTFAWELSFNTGGGNGFDRGSHYYVRLVRGGQ